MLSGTGISHVFAQDSDSLRISVPIFHDARGEKIKEIGPGEQVVIVHSVANNIYPDEISVVSILDVRDQAGVTQFIAWQGMQIKSGQTREIGVSWILPDDEVSGSGYSVRVFAVGDFGSNPVPLSAVFQSELMVR